MEREQVVSVADRLLLKDWEAAELLSVSVATLKKLPIPRVTLPEIRSVRWRRVDIESYVKGLAA